MHFNEIRGTNLRVSAVGLGCNNFGITCDEKASHDVILAALDAGINFFDTADVYGGRGRSEEILGRAVKVAGRHSVIVATKFANPMSDDGNCRGASRDYIVRAVEASLKRLGTDYIDLYQQHVPDSSTPIDETLRALDDLVQQGKVRFIGSSNFASWQIADADWAARSAGTSRFVTAQNEYSLMARQIERDVIPACGHFDVSIIPYFPLAKGMLTGKYQRGRRVPEGTRLASMGERRRQRVMSDANFDRIDELDKVARSNGRTLLDLAMSWLAAKPFIPSVIAGATSAEQIRQNAEAVAWKLTPTEMEEIDLINMN